jgi:hypothetical protein
VIDLDVARRAASLGCTSDEIATLLGVCRRTFFNHLKADEGLQEAIDEGRDQGRITLRRLQWEQAKAGNPTMLIWLGKQLLGQRDKHEVEQSGTQTLQFQHLIAARAASDYINGTRVIDGDAVAATETNQEPTPIDLMTPALE